MLQKAEVLNLINSISNEQNKEKLQKYIDLVNSMDDSTLADFLQEHGVESVETLKTKLESKVGRGEENNVQFTELNDLVSYGVTVSTIHIHLVPKDAHFILTRQGLMKAEGLLIDALAQIKDMIKEDTNITNVYAVSDIMQSLIAKMFARLGFDVKVLPLEQAKDDVDLGKFYERFKDSKLGKIGGAVISRERLISPEWEELKEKRQNELEEKSKRNIVQDR